MTHNNYKIESPYEVQAKSLFEQYQRQYSKLCVLALKTGFSIPKDPFDDQLEKARQNWLQENIVRLEKIKLWECDFQGKRSMAKKNWNEAIKYTQDRYKSELNQDTNKTP